MSWRREDYLALVTFQPHPRPMFVELFGPLVGLEQQWRALGHAAVRLGLRGAERAGYRKLLAWTLWRKPRLLPLAVRLTAATWPSSWPPILTPTMPWRPTPRRPTPPAERRPRPSPRIAAGPRPGTLPRR